MLADGLSLVTDSPICHQAISAAGVRLQQCLPSLGSRVTESQAYTDIHTKDRPALAGGPSVDKRVFSFGGKRRGCECSLTLTVPVPPLSDGASHGHDTQRGESQAVLTCLCLSVHK